MRNDIYEFVAPALKGGLFSKEGIIKDIEIITLKNKDINLKEYHALVSIEPESSALRVIKKLHGQRFKDKRITVRQYFTRRWQNDKRTENQQLNNEGFKEKRNNATRRRNMEVIQEKSIGYSSSKTFHRYLY